MSALPHRPCAPRYSVTSWNGPAYRGAMKQLHRFRHEEAVERNSRTPPERRSRKREAARAAKYRPPERTP